MSKNLIDCRQEKRIPRFPEGSELSIWNNPIVITIVKSLYFFVGEFQKRVQRVMIFDHVTIAVYKIDSKLVVSPMIRFSDELILRAIVQTEAEAQNKGAHHDHSQERL